MATSEPERPKLKLYSNWMSSCSWRVRIALYFKGLDYEYKAINLQNRSSPEFQKLSPLGFVPVLVDEDVVIADSFAIILHLEEKYPEQPLLPQDLQKRGLNYQIANLVASSIQPLQNLVVQNYIEEKLGADERLPWVQYHVKRGLAALEKLLEGHAGKYATGDEIALADLFLAPQIGLIKRFNIELAEFPLLKRLNDAYSEIPAFKNTAPGKQPDAPDDVKSF